jgi:hypothetical protein
MLKNLTFCLFCCVAFSSLSQTTVTQDTLTNPHDEVDISYTVVGNSSTYTDISIHQFTIVDSDTISVFAGTYNLDEDDPSSFLTFSFDESTGMLVFGIGAFEPGTFYSIIEVVNSSGTEEEFIFN